MEPYMTQFLTRFLNNESGATAIEYGLITSLIAVVIIPALIAVGLQLELVFQTISNALDSANF